MNTLRHHRGFAALAALTAAFLLLANDTALADPPTRVARLAHVDGVVSFAPAGEDEWAIAKINRPFTIGDRIWSDTGSRAELQLGDASIRLGASTSATILNLDDRIAQLQLAQGAVNLRVRRSTGGQSYEVDTPNLALTVTHPGEYRIEVDPSGGTTTVSNFRGEAEVYGENNSYAMGERERYRFSGTDLRDCAYLDLAPPDEFDRWAFDRDRREDTSVSARYVSPDVIGYSDLDDNGTWSTVQGYGPVWTPARVDAGWAPYREGHWAWVDPWGWTWVDDEPWGFAPFHYGRWAYLRDRWCWVPGPRAAQPVYAPALVAFVGGRNFNLSVSAGPEEGVAWFPLAPGEVYRPAYNVSRNYFTNVNVSNTTVNVASVTRVYERPETSVVYRNREAPRSVTAVPVQAFAAGRPVAQSAVPVSHEVVARAQVTDVAPVTPTRASLIAGAAATGARATAKPPAEVVNRAVVAKTQPAPTPAPFAARERELAAHPGRPVEITAAGAAAKSAGTPAPGKSAESPAAPKSAAVTAATQPAAAPPPNVKIVAPTTPKPAPARAEAAKGPGAQPTPGTSGAAGVPPKTAQTPGAPPAQAGVARAPGSEKAVPKEALKQPAPQANVPRPPEAQQGAPQQALRAPAPQANAPRPPQAAKAPEEPVRRAPQANAPRPPEVQRAPPSSQATLAPREPARAAPAQALRAPPPQASVPRPSEAPKAPPQAVRAPPPQAKVPTPEQQRATPREPPRTPPPQTAAPRPQEAPKTPPPQALRAPPPQVAVRPPEPPRANAQRAPEPPQGAPPGAPPKQPNIARAPEPHKAPPPRAEEKKTEEGK